MREWSKEQPSWGFKYKQRINFFNRNELLEEIGKKQPFRDLIDYCIIIHLVYQATNE